MEIDYTTVTEVPGNRVTRDQLERMFHRYRFAADFCCEKDVLEVACGAGQGLGYLAKTAKRIIGGDYTENLIHQAHKYYGDEVPLLRLDAHALPFMDHSLDVVILYEALYYLAFPEKFFQEVRRVLRKGGVLLIATVNQDWSEFNPSPLSARYFSVPELAHLLHQCGYKMEFYGAFSTLPKGLREKTIAIVRRMAVGLHLIPKTMKGKELLKKVFYGRLLPLKEEIEEGIAEYFLPVPIQHDIPNSEYKIIYAVASI